MLAKQVGRAPLELALQVCEEARATITQTSGLARNGVSANHRPSVRRVRQNPSGRLLKDGLLGGGARMSLGLGDQASAEMLKLTEPATDGSKKSAPYKAGGAVPVELTPPTVKQEMSALASKILKEVGDARSYSMSLKPFDVAQDLVKQMAEHAKTMERGTAKCQDRDGRLRATPESNRARFWHLRVSQETFYRKISAAMQAADAKAYRWWASGRTPVHTVHRCENSVGVGPVALLLGCQPSERTSGTCTSNPQFFQNPLSGKSWCAHRNHKSPIGSE